ncbi:MAG: type VI secretion system baseplate subunit TssF [Gammaproteobacteria bacterium]|nr:type VI secretion system baseplate subunit TssF [Gammaproteobacteria bacterium]
MDPRLLDYYNQELSHLREAGAEFSKEFPKIAGRLGLEEFECADPYVERLLEGFAFLTARIRLRMDAEFPRFTQHLLTKVYPHYLAPTPSMTVVQMQPIEDEGALAEGVPVERDTTLRSMPTASSRTVCRYQTGHKIDLWPLQVVEAEYFPSAGSVATLGVPEIKGTRAGIRLRLKTTGGLKLEELQLDQLQLYLHGSDAVPYQLYEQILGNVISVAVMPRESEFKDLLPRTSVVPIGFEQEHALLPYTDLSFRGYRLLQEYFAFPQRFLFINVNGLQRAISHGRGDELDVVFVLDRTLDSLDRMVSKDNFQLHCTTAINLFSHTCDRIDMRKPKAEYHLIPDRTRPMDFEVFSVGTATGYGAAGERTTEFKPLYAVTERLAQDEEGAYFTTRREPRMLSAKQQRDGPRSTYVGSEIFVSIVNSDELPFSSNLRQLAVKTLCTNRDLPLHLPVGQKKKGDFTLESSLPVETVRCMAGPTRPKRPLAHGNNTWRLISHLSLNYLSLVERDETEGAAALREILGLYGDIAEAPVRKQIDGLQRIQTTDIVRRLPIPGPVTFGRGLQIELQCFESAFQGAGVFLFGAVLDTFFARYVSMNSFTETVLSSDERGEIMRWPAKIGQRHRL